jgi:hypothetical protein
MRIIELKIEDNYIDTVLDILKSLKNNIIKEINIKDTTSLKNSDIKKVDFSEFSGMWQDRDIDTKSIRKEAWKKQY